MKIDAPIVLAGIHDGLDATKNLLETLGLHPNPKFARVNLELLESAGAAHDFIPRAGIWPNLSPSLHQQVEELFTTSEAGDSWLWIDRDALLLAGFWNELFLTRSIAARWIVLVSSPTEAIRLKSDGYSERLTVHIWNAHYLNWDHSRHSVRHLMLSASPLQESEAKQIASFIGIALPGNYHTTNVMGEEEDEPSISNSEGETRAKFPEACGLYQMLIGAQREHGSSPRDDDDVKSPEVSIIIPVHNNLAFTQACVASIRQYTPIEHEIIIVDNGSTDGTTEWLRLQAANKGLVALRNENNRGFAGAINQGLSLARGKTYLLLNNDVIVTSGWIEALLRALHTNPGVGLVGAMSNNVSGNQRVPCAAYNTEAEMHKFVSGWVHANRDQTMHTSRLTGMCLLISKKVVDAIGGFDERFFPGNFEDDDYGLRAQVAGFKMLVARDAYVHHEGSRTFQSIGGFAESLYTNFERFKTKWRLPADLGYGMAFSVSVEPDTDLFIPLPMIRARERKVKIKFGGQTLPESYPSISLCLVVRDEAENLAPCLAPLLPIVDEVIVLVDSRTTDETVEIAHSLGDKVNVSIYEWDDTGFAGARNASIAKASGEWILWCDADDRHDELAVRQVQQAAAATIADAYFFKIESQVPEQNMGQMGRVVSQHLRMFRNHQGVRFSGAVHEDATRSAWDAEFTLAETDIVVRHIGYEAGQEALQSKAQRNMPYLLKQVVDEPQNLEWRFQLASCLQILGDLLGAIEQCQFILAHHQGSGDNGQNSLNTPGEFYRTHAMLATSLLNMGQEQDAFRVLQQAFQRFPDNKHLWILTAMFLLEIGDATSAIEAVEQAERLPEFSCWQWPPGMTDILRERAQIKLAH